MDWPNEPKMAMAANWGYESSALVPQNSSSSSSTIDCSVDLRLGHLSHFGSNQLPMASIVGPTSQALAALPVPNPVPRRQREKEVYCLVEGCNADLSKSRDYHRKHKVCETHSKTAVVIVGGKEQRFCQQCSRFHSVAEFDAQKRSCRKRLLFHNRRRRKPLQDDSISSRGLFANQHGTRLSSYQQIYSAIDATPEPVRMSNLYSLRNDQTTLHASSALNLNSQNFFNSTSTYLGAIGSTRHEHVPVSDCALSLLSSSPYYNQPSNNSSNLQICHSLQMQENNQFHAGLNVSVMHVSEGVSLTGFQYNGLYEEGSASGNIGLSPPFSWQ
ncbi:hypothetical protein LUZ60_002068 [Juncus effusus]|nr:hypothetical protein LUZ60_002068 [Juncus effusus]